MFRLFGRGRTQKLNTVDLVGDMDDVELLQAIEQVFDIEIEGDEVRELYTVGQLYDLVKTKLEGKPNFDPVWALTEEIVREHSGSREVIDRETTFFAKHASKRSSHG